MRTASLPADRQVLSIGVQRPAAVESAAARRRRWHAACSLVLRQTDARCPQTLDKLYIDPTDKPTDKQNDKPDRLHYVRCSRSDVGPHHLTSPA